MNKQIKVIKLSQISLETNFRNKEKDLSLELSINRHGLQVPLIVEKESENNYVLVDGYRRFYALKFLGVVGAICSIKDSSSEEERIIKRLGIELHTKRKTSYQLERMINRLLENKKYDVKLIASLCDVTEGTIAKYIRGSEVNRKWLERGEKTGAGRHAFTDIHRLNLSEENKNFIADKYIDRKINKSSVDVIKKATNEKGFEDIPEERVKECIDLIIEQQSKNYESVGEIVSETNLQSRYNRSSHTTVHNLNLNLLIRIEKIFKNKNYVDYLSKKQKDKLAKSFQNLILILNPPLKWSEFPSEKRFNERSEEGGSLEQ